MSRKKLSRRYTRENTLKFIFRYEFFDELDVSRESENFFKLMDIDEKKLDKEYFELVSRGIYDNKINIDNIIESHLTGWSIKRISKVDLSIIRIAIFEINKLFDIPLNIAINEAVELAKKYSNEKSPSFVNGLLSKVPEDVLK